LSASVHWVFCLDEIITYIYEIITWYGFTRWAIPIITRQKTRQDEVIICRFLKYPSVQPLRRLLDAWEGSQSVQRVNVLIGGRGNTPSRRISKVGLIRFIHSPPQAAGPQRKSNRSVINRYSWTDGRDESIGGETRYSIGSRAYYMLP
jgi:hypothetical protein